MTVKTTVLKDVAMVMLNISVWSGAKKLEPRDFMNVDVEDLPSEDVASYGIKYLIDKKRLQPFNTIRGRAEKLCGRYGTRLLGGYAIPQDCVDFIGRELQALCDQFEAEIDDFMSQYDNGIEDWISANPDFSEPLRRSILPRGEVRGRFKASFSIFEISASPRDRTDSMASVGSDLMDSVLASVLAALKPQIARKPGCGDPDWFRVEVRHSIIELAQKLHRFSFCDPTGGMKVLASDLEASVNAGTGKIADAEFAHLWKIIGRFTSVDEIKAAIAARSSGFQQQPEHNDAVSQPETIKDDLGFPLGDFEQGGDRDHMPDQKPPEVYADDGFPPFTFDQDVEYGESSDSHRAKDLIGDVQKKAFSTTFDF